MKSLNKTKSPIYIALCLWFQWQPSQTLFHTIETDCVPCDVRKKSTTRFKVSFPAHQGPSENGSTVNGKNILLLKGQRIH